MKNSINSRIAAFTVFLIVSLSAVFELHAQKEPVQIKSLSLNEATIGNAARLISSLTHSRVIATAEARQKTVDLMVQDANLEDTLKLVCRSSGLVFKTDEDSKIYTIMTIEEYRKGAGADTNGDFALEVFQVEPANVNQIAAAIESLYGEDVWFTEGEEVEDFSEEPGESSGRGRSGLSGGNFRGGGRSFGSGGRFGRSGIYGRGTSDRYSNNNRIGALEAVERESAKINPEEPADPDSEESQAPKRIKEPTIYVTNNLEHNLLIIRTADRTAMKQIGELVERLNKPVPQVILEMKILELAVGDGKRVGFDYSGTKGDEIFSPKNRNAVTGLPTELEFLGQESSLGMGSLATEAASSFVYEYLSQDLRARVQMLADDNSVEVVATPMLVAANNRPAEITVGEDRVLTVGASSDVFVAGESGSRNSLITIETESRNIGTRLRVIPRINADETVTLFVEQESSTLKQGNNTLLIDGTQVPIDSVDVASISATVMAKNRNTVAVGGLIRTSLQDNNSKVPIAGDLPLLGKLFRRQDQEQRKTELVLLITPYVIGPGENAKMATDELTKRLSDHRFHTGGAELIEKDIPELQRYVDDNEKAIARRERDLIRKQKEKLEGSKAVPPAKGSRRKSVFPKIFGSRK
ncbi:MAG: hypothetical protein MK183_08295 [Verrucomicrobiales bacterium]|nr:hypothetical protein [Verrucomicrobiales bacterium]